MMHWPWWLGGLMLAVVAVSHLWLTGHALAVSGRFTALINRLRHGPPAPAPVMDDAQFMAELLAATAALTAEAGLPVAPSPDPSPTPAASSTPVRPPPPMGLTTHLLFLLGLLSGGALAAGWTGSWQVHGWLAGPGFTAAFGQGPGAALALLLGGVLVGAGTRMAGGCTSGHGLCGVSRAQAGSMVSTAAFFGVGILTASVIWRLS